MVRSVVPESGTHSFEAFLGNQNVGKLVTGPAGAQQAVRLSYLDPKFQGMGLGKKMYGEAMRQMPGGTLRSDDAMSDAATGLWTSLKNKGRAVQLGDTFVGRVPQKAVLNLPKPPPLPSMQPQLKTG
jgi:hypothetical protein